MGATTDSEEIDQHRRRFLRTTAIAVAAAELSALGAANAQSATTTQKHSLRRRARAPTPSEASVITQNRP